MTLNTCARGGGARDAPWVAMVRAVLEAPPSPLVEFPLNDPAYENNTASITAALVSKLYELRSQGARRGLRCMASLPQAAPDLAALPVEQTPM